MKPQRLEAGEAGGGGLESHLALCFLHATWRVQSLLACPCSSPQPHRRHAPQAIYRPRNALPISASAVSSGVRTSTLGT